jgi:TetR/AcrR family transcriptional regulator, transcriptional repressor for nem operon
MTDSAVRPVGDKRQRLITAARDLIHRQGVERTTLADIAQSADVPVGNVYYYFKTNDELVEATIQSQIEDMQSMLSSLDNLPTPKARVKGLIQALCSHAEIVAQYGCPLGSLCSELDKRTDPMEGLSEQLLKIPVGWLRGQFQEMGRRDSDDLAIAFMASYLGIALLANTYQDPKVMTNESRRIELWVDSL